MTQRFSLTVYLVVFIVSSGCTSVPDTNSQTPNKLVKAVYGEPNPSAPEQIKQFGRLAGKWQCALKERRADGSWRPRPSDVTWTWFYTLSGHAVQDIWTPQEGAADSNVIASNLRMFDVRTGLWNVSWTNTQQNSFELWSGGVEGDEIVMTSVRDRRPVKIRFFNMLPRRFQWSYEAANSLQSSDFTPVLQMQCFLTD